MQKNLCPSISISSFFLYFQKMLGLSTEWYPHCLIIIDSIYNYFWKIDYILYKIIFLQKNNPTLGYFKSSLHYFIIQSFIPIFIDLPSTVPITVSCWPLLRFSIFEISSNLVTICPSALETSQRSHPYTHLAIKSLINY